MGFFCCILYLKEYDCLSFGEFWLFLDIFLYKYRYFVDRSFFLGIKKNCKNRKKKSLLLFRNQCFDEVVLGFVIMIIIFGILGILYWIQGVFVGINQ